MKIGMLSVTIGLVFAAAAWHTTSAQQRTSTPFTIILETNDSGWVATCTEGCAWQRLAYKCHYSGGCRARVNHNGVLGLAPR